MLESLGATQQAEVLSALRVAIQEQVTLNISFVSLSPNLRVAALNPCFSVYRGTEQDLGRAWYPAASRRP